MELPNAAAMRRLVIGLWIVATLLLVAAVGHMLFVPQADPGRFRFPAVPSSKVVEAPDGHAYQYVAAPNISWERARAAAARNGWQGHKGYLATIGSAAEFQFVMQNVFPEENDVTYLGGRQTEPGQWRWVTGPEAAADGGKGTLFWKGYENGQAVDGHYADWMFSAFQHGGKWDVAKVCCVTLFSYRKRQLSTSLGTGDSLEGVAGYLVEYGE